MSFDVNKSLYDYLAHDGEIKRREELKKQCRAELLSHVTASARQRQRPKKIVVVRHDYWNKTGLSENTFFATRHPGWQIKDKKSDIEAAESTYILERDVDFVPHSESIQKFSITKQVQEFAPEIDWVSLQKERPDLFDKISRPKVVYELDEQGFEKTVAECPELLDVMSRHLKVKRPVIKLLVREEKDED